jgi:hypothetical protein
MWNAKDKSRALRMAGKRARHLAARMLRRTFILRSGSG